jgi:hypothetical protein
MGQRRSSGSTPPLPFCWSPQAPRLVGGQASGGMDGKKEKKGEEGAPAGEHQQKATAALQQKATAVHKQKATAMLKRKATAELQQHRQVVVRPLGW